MQVTKHEIDSQILGRAILEVSGPYDGELAQLEAQYVREQNPRLVIYKAPIEDIASIQALEEHGFQFIETQLRLTQRLRKPFDTGKTPYSFERVTTEEHLAEVLEIAGSTFTDDRFLVDPKLPDAHAISAARYQAYVRQSFVRENERVYRLVNAAGKTVAFKTNRIVNPEEALMLLGGVHADYKAAGLAAINAFYDFNELIKNGVRRFTTHVSARNYGVMNLEISGFQYKIKQTFIVLRKLYA